MIDRAIETPSFRIEKADRSLIPDVYEIVSTAAQHMADKNGFTHWVSYYTLESVTHKFDEGDVYVGYLDDELVAVAGIAYEAPAYLEEDELAFFTPIDGKVGYPRMLAVKPDLRKQGLGKVMAERIIQIAEESGAKAVRFDARAEDVALIAFHRGFGYKEMGQKEYEPGESYIFFEKIF